MLLNLGKNLVYIRCILLKVDNYVLRTKKG